MGTRLQAWGQADDQEPSPQDGQEPDDLWGNQEAIAPGPCPSSEDLAQRGTNGVERGHTKNNNSSPRIEMETLAQGQSHSAACAHTLRYTKCKHHPQK